MEKHRNRKLVVLLAAMLFAAGPAIRSAFPQGKAAVPTEQQTKAQLKDAHAQQLLLLMDTDKNGKVSKQEWMNFMEAEFNRLDKDKTGELTPAELAQSKLQVSTFAKAGK